jgi:acetolactate decarboxylase
MKKEKVFQTGTIASLLNLVYEGDTTIAELRQYGNFGIGTCASFDGEIIVYDNKFYHATASGQIIEISDSAILPFAVLTSFNTTQEFNSSNLSFQALKDDVRKHLLSCNLIYAVKIEAEFNSISFRSCRKETHPNHKIADDLTKLQQLHHVSNVKGLLVGFWFPKDLQTVNVPGLHVHFMDAERKIGGHVFDCQILQAQIMIQKCDSLQIDLIENDEFYNADLDNITDVDSVENHIKK